MQIIIACDDTHLHSQNLEGRGRGITLSFRVRPHLKKKPKRQKHPEKGILCKVLATLQYHGGKSLGPASWSDRRLYPVWRSKKPIIGLVGLAEWGPGRGCLPAALRDDWNEQKPVLKPCQATQSTGRSEEVPHLFISWPSQVVKDPQAGSSRHAQEGHEASRVVTNEIGDLSVFTLQWRPMAVGKEMDPWCQLWGVYCCACRGALQGQLAEKSPLSELVPPWASAFSVTDPSQKACTARFMLSVSEEEVYPVHSKQNWCDKCHITGR